MRETNPERFEPTYKQKSSRNVDNIDVSDLVPIKSKVPRSSKRTRKDMLATATPRKSSDQKETKDDKMTTLQTYKQGSLQPSKLTNLQTYIRKLLDDKSTEVGSFRMSEALLEKIDDLQHLLKKRFKVKLNKKDLVAIALAFAFWDLETNGKDSGIIKARRKSKED